MYSLSASFLRKKCQLEDLADSFWSPVFHFDWYLTQVPYLVLGLHNYG